MRIYVKGKVIAVENERDAVVYGKKSRVATIVMQTLDGENFCAKCFGREKVNVCKEKLKCESYAEFVITITGRALTGKGEHPDQIIYVNDVSIKWILS